MEPSVNLPTPFDVTVGSNRTAVRVVPSGELDAGSRIGTALLAEHNVSTKCVLEARVVP